MSPAAHDSRRIKQGRAPISSKAFVDSTAFHAHAVDHRWFFQQLMISVDYLHRRMEIAHRYAGGGKDSVLDYP